MRYLTGRGNVRCGIHLVREISVGHLSGRESVRQGCAWSGKFPSGICLVGEMSVGDVSGRGNVCRGSVRRGRVRRGNVRRGCVRESYGTPMVATSASNLAHFSLICIPYRNQLFDLLCILNDWFLYKMLHWNEME